MKRIAIVLSAAVAAMTLSACAYDDGYYGNGYYDGGYYNGGGYYGPGYYDPYYQGSSDWYFDGGYYYYYDRPSHRWYRRGGHDNHRGDHDRTGNGHRDHDWHGNHASSRSADRPPPNARPSGPPPGWHGSDRHGVQNAPHNLTPHSSRGAVEHRSLPPPSSGHGNQAPSDSFWNRHNSH